VPHTDLIDSLIATYRELNMKLRPLPESRITAKGSDGASVRDIVAEMRNRELIASQQLKYMMLADVAGAEADVVDPTSLVPVDSQPLRTLLSEFGTARESILAVVREMPEAELDREIPSPNGPKAIATFLQELNTLDTQDRRKIDQLLA
jgi:hypothetical protein